MEKWKAKNASHFSTPPTTATSHINYPSRYTNISLAQKIGQTMERNVLGKSVLP
jgi:hypothetical protein